MSYFALGGGHGKTTLTSRSSLGSITRFYYHNCREITLRMSSSGMWMVKNDQIFVKVEFEWAEGLRHPPTHIFLLDTICQNEFEQNERG